MTVYCEPQTISVALDEDKSEMFSSIKKKEKGIWIGWPGGE